jgi:hypothetical protein
MILSDSERKLLLSDPLAFLEQALATAEDERRAAEETKLVRRVRSRAAVGAEGSQGL